GGVTIASLKRLAEEGVVGRDERVVVYITGLGLKTLDAVEKVVGPTATISPTLDSFHEAFDPDQIEE
ncbi:MAG TPA: threonine synthase, partial [Acidimicrobiia bacterium]